MSLNQLLTDSGDPVFYEAGFRRVVESHLTYLRALDSTYWHPITPQQCTVYEGDFYGLLDELRIPKAHQWSVLVLNRLRHPGEFLATQQSVLLPDFSVITGLRAVYMSRKIKQ